MLGSYYGMCTWNTTVILLNYHIKISMLYTSLKLVNAQLHMRFCFGKCNDIMNSHGLFIVIDITFIFTLVELVDMGFVSTWCYPDIKWKQVYAYFMSE